jgi:choline-sulfatase
MPKPNVLLVTIDCLRRDRCGFAGHNRDTTPTLDELATESVVFDRAHAPGSRTAESVPGILSGRLSADCAYLDELSYKAIPRDAETLGTWLRRHGYETLATISNPQLSPVRNFDRGFDRFTNLRIAEEGDRFETLVQDSDEDETGRSLLSRVGRWLLSVGDSVPVRPATVAYVLYRYYQLYNRWPTVAGEEVIAELSEDLATTGTPFFAWVHLNDLHSPLHPGRVRSGGLLSSSNLRQFGSDSNRVRHLASVRYELMYDSVVRYVDAQIRTLFDFLREIGEYDDTLVVVTADHGEALGDRGIYGHASGHEQRLYDEDRDYLYRELLNVPLLIRPPSGESAIVDAPFSLTWLHRAIAEIVDLPDGQFVESPARSHEDAAETVFADSLTERGHTVAAITETTKIITDGTSPDEIDPEKWIQIDAVDEGERRWVEGGDIAPDLRDSIEDRIVAPESVQRVQGRISESTRQRLADLGYR